MPNYYSSALFLERRITMLYGIHSLAMKAFDLVKEEMCIEKGFKRDNGADYYIHCVDVANTLISFGIVDEDAVSASLMHDVPEDVKGYSIITIEKLFNENIARIVSLVTKEPGVDYKQPENLIGYLDRIKTNAYASAVKAGDRMNNMMTLQEKSFEARYRKAMETKEYYLPFFKYCRKTFPRFEHLFYAAKAQTEPMIFHIESYYNEIQRLNKLLESNGIKTSGG